MADPPKQAGQDAPLDYHRAMVDDPLRLHAWDRAIRAVCGPGRVVLDAGAGTAVLGMLAARHGARVHAVEAAPVASLAEALVAHNGLEGRLTVHRADLETLAPIEPVDAVLCDFVGRFLPDEVMRRAALAAGRWLKPQGRFLPGRVRLLVAPVADVLTPEIDRFAHPLLGLDLSPALGMALDRAYRVELPRAALLAEPIEIGVLRPPSDLPPEIHATARFEALREGAVVGFAGWFEAELVEGVVLDTAPGHPGYWGQVLWPVPRQRVAAGAPLDLRLQARSAPGRVDFAWQGEVDGHPFAHRGDRSSLWSASPLDASAARKARHDGEAALAAGRVEEAARLLGEASRAVDDPGLHAAHGEALARAGQPALALHPLLRAAEAEDDERALRWLVGSLAHLGRHDEARAALDRYEARFGAHPFVHR